MFGENETSCHASFICDRNFKLCPSVHFPLLGFGIAQVLEELIAAQLQTTFQTLLQLAVVR